MVLVLTLIAIAAGAALAYVNSVTAPQIEKINQDNLNKGIKEVLGVAADAAINVETPDTFYMEGKEKKADNIQFIIYKTDQGTAVSSVTNGFGGALKVLVGFDSEGTIKGYTVLAHSETPGLGAKAQQWFQKDGKGCIIGLNLGNCNLTVSKDGGDIDAITASTITSRAFLTAVKNAYDKFMNGEVDAQTSATQQEKKGGQE